MPVNYWTIPDSSPWIDYQGSWGDSDSDITAYVNDTFHFTQTANAAAVITFNGTGVSLYGAKRGNHGNYVVSVDSKTATFSGQASPDVFNQTLFSTKLPPASHTISLTNPTAGAFVDLDYAVIEVGDGNPNTSSNDVWMDDTHPNVTYDPTWDVSTNPAIQDQYFNSTFHLSSTPNGTATINFSGHQIAVYGAASTNHGGYSVSLDGMPPQSYNGSEKTFRAQQLLYFASSLSNGTHKVVLTVTQPETDLDFDYAIATTYWTVGPSTSSSSTTPTSSDNAQTSHTAGSSTPVAAIAGGVVGGLVMLGIIALLLFLIYRQRKKNQGDAIFSQKGHDALGHELAPGVSVAAMATYGGMRGPSPQRSYAEGLGANYASSGTTPTTPGIIGHQYAPRVQEPYGMAAPVGSGEPLLSGRGGNEIDMPPPNYDHVFSQAGSSGGGSQMGGSSVGGSQVGSSSAGGSLPAPPNPQNGQIYRQLREKGVVVPQTSVNRATSD